MVVSEVEDLLEQRGRVGRPGGGGEAAGVELGLLVGVVEARGLQPDGAAAGDLLDRHEVEPRLVQLVEERRGVLARARRSAA